MHRSVVHVGWLSVAHPFPKGPVDHQVVERMKLLAANPVNLYRGYHFCDLCPDRSARGNGEIRAAGDGIIYAAPVLIVHYIEAHGYQPPAAFLAAIASMIR